MRTKILIGAGIVLAIFIIFLIAICGGSAGNNVMPEEKLVAHISGVTCEYEGGDDLTYDISTITNDKNFDSSIAARSYSKITINNTESFKSLGICFLVKSDYETNLTFTLMKNDETLKSHFFTLKANETKSVELPLESSVDVSIEDKFYITVTQDNNLPFSFDTFLFLFDEVS